MKTIRLARQTLVAYVDDEDFELVNKYHWHLNVCRGLHYARTAMTKPRIYMHQLILPNCPVGMRREHRDGDGLNNQRYNLEIISHSDNIRRGKYRTWITLGI